MSKFDPESAPSAARAVRPDGSLAGVQPESGWRYVWMRLRSGWVSRWRWLAAVVAVCAGLGFLAGYAAGTYTATVELLASKFPAVAASSRDSGSLVDSASVDSVVQLLRSDTALRRVARGSRLSLTPESIASASEVSRIPESGLVTIKVKGSDLHRTVQLANIYGEEASAAARQIWLSQCQELNHEVTERLASVDEQMARTSSEWLEFQRRTLGTDFSGDEGSTLRHLTDLDRKAEGIRSQISECDSLIQNLNREIARLTPALVTARDALAQALTRYTEEHPKVKELRATIESLEAQCVPQTGSGQSSMVVLSSPAAVSLYTRVMELRSQRTSWSRDLEATERQRKELQAQMAHLPGNQATYVRLKSQLEALRAQRFLLAQRLQETQLAEKDSGGVRVIASASLESVDRSPKIRSGLTIGSLAGGGGLLLATLWAAAFPSTTRRIRTEHDLEEATRLPLLATLDDLSPMTLQDRQEWAFRTLTLLRGRCTTSDREALICGFTSAVHAEGRSTWIGLLAEAADRLGYRVATISAVRPHQALEVTANTTESARASGDQRSSSLPDLGPFALMRSSPGAGVPVSTWVRNLDHREQWRRAVQEWGALDGLVVFVEMPPASAPEAVLLAEGLPNVVWLSGKDMASFSETRVHLDILRHVRTHLVGCVLNRAAASRRRPVRDRLLAASVGAACLFLAGDLQAQETNRAAEPQPLAIPEVAGPVSIGAPNRVADWQKRLVLGPGDQFDLVLYEQPETLRPGLVIGPDGRLNYLEARDVMAAGLTVDELRAHLEGVLSKFHRSPRVVVNPIAYNSKKYYVLGNVNLKGVFLLDRPVSVIEAIARAKGFVSGAPVGRAVATAAAEVQRNTLVQADLPRSFLVRRGADGVTRRVALDFEGLFLRGDLSQNVALEPGDYLYFPPLDLQEVYVLGQVRSVGVVPYTPDLTCMGAIAARAGFAEKAWRQKVLVVRGSLSRPQTFVVDAADILSAKGPDFPLKNRDIIYVHEQPWALAEELAELAVVSFAQSFIIGWTTLYVGPLKKQPLIESPSK